MKEKLVLVKKKGQQVYTRKYITKDGESASYFKRTNVHTIDGVDWVYLERCKPEYADIIGWTSNDVEVKMGEHAHNFYDHNRFALLSNELERDLAIKPLHQVECNSDYMVEFFILNVVYNKIYNDQPACIENDSIFGVHWSVDCVWGNWSMTIYITKDIYFNVPLNERHINILKEYIERMYRRLYIW